MKDSIFFAVIGASTLLVYAWTMPVTITLADAGLFQMVCHLGGIGHAPGYPLFTALCQQVVPYFPLSVIAGNLLSSIFGSIACVIFYKCLRLLSLDALTAFIAALVFGFSGTMWAQSIVIEVYSLTVLGFVTCWLLLLFWVSGKGASYLYAAAFVFGLSLSNHWPLMVLSTPALLLTLLPARLRLIQQVRSPRVWAAAIFFSLLGLFPYLFLLLQPNPEIALFGPLDDVGKFLAYVTRSVYDVNENQAIAGFHDKLGFLFWLPQESARQFGFIGAPLIVIGLIYGVKKLPKYLTIQMLLLYLGSTAILVFLLNISFEYLNRAVFQPWLVLANLALAYWFALGVRFTLDQLNHASSGRLAGLLIAAIIASVVVSNYSKTDRRSNHWVDLYGRQILASLPQNAVYFAQDEFELGVLGYLHEVIGLRPDIELRNPGNQFFSNRLVSPFEPSEIQREALFSYLEQNTAPVFASTIVMHPQKLFGAYYQHAPAEGRSVARLPALDKALDYLLDLYLNKLITDPNEKIFAYNQLVGFARQYVLLALTEKLSEEEYDRLKRLQSTFPGRLVSLEILIPRPPPGAKPALSELALAAKADIPEETPRQSRGLLYEYLGRIALLESPDDEAAIRYFERSIDIYSLAENKSLCPLAKLYDMKGDTDKLMELKQKFGKFLCSDEA